MGLAKYKAAQALYESEQAGFFESQKKGGNGGDVDHDFVKSVLKSGTVADKTAALTLSIAESPLHNLSNLQTLLNMSKKKGRREALLAVESLCELAENNLLPDRKLLYFQDQPVPDTGKARLTEKQLVEWYFEDNLKKLYFEFVKVLEQISHDTLRYVREKAISCVYRLLNAKVEQRANLLALLANKLGDVERQVASKASYHLLKLLDRHPAMKMDVIKATEQVIFRPNIGQRAQYYGLIFLNQICLKQMDTDAARTLINVYFQLFFLLTTPSAAENTVTRPNKKIKFNQDSKNDERKLDFDSVNPKMLAALLSGVHRAFPYAQLGEDNPVEKHIDSLFRLTHANSFSICVEALLLIQLVCDYKVEASDRFYRCLYSSLLEPSLLSFSKPALYINLLYKSLKQAMPVSQMSAFLCRLCQLATFAEVPFAAATLYLVSELLKVHPGCWSLVKFAPEAGAAVYDWRKRAPQYAAAENTCLWELVALSHHFHPTLSLYASTLLKGEFISFPESSVNYDPLLNHTLIRFLDRLAYRNPKQVTSKNFEMEKTGKVTRVTQPREQVCEGKVYGNATLIKGGKKLLLQVNNKLTDDAPVNQEDFISMTPSSVNPDERFCHQYFQLCPRANVSLDEGGQSEDSDDLFDAKMEELGAEAMAKAGLENGDSDDESIALLNSASETEADSAVSVPDESTDVESDAEFGSDFAFDDEEGVEFKEDEDDGGDPNVFADASEYEHLINRDD